ncbi:M13 family metallopeptidase [Solimicrobium silvestre]|uniref:Putative metalloendopeptidase n=1 Tax=Solimicrobium silvestre TaxID=2099400 RepID=A0A2S9GX75_9BURK|nr:M13 family metallopeptidase [Solimicrobium silvestre]PRC92324.1 putative metalloendopeptidase [Solimicrobium silvestre]
MFKKTPLQIGFAAALLCFAAPSFSAASGFVNGLVIEPQTMDRSADPCTDFFEFSNGQWLKDNPIPEDRSRYSAYDEVTERNLSALKKIAENAAKNPDKATPAQRIVGAYFHSGMDEAGIEAAGAKPLAEGLAQIAAIQTRTQLMDAIAQQHQIGAAPLFNFYIDQDAKNTLRYIPQLAQGGLGLPDRDYYLKSDAKTLEIRSKYSAHLEKMFSLLGDTPEVAKHNAAIVLSMETRLARASMSKIELRDPQASYHLMTLAGLAKIDHGTDWTNYFNQIGLKAPGEINVAQPKFFAEAGHMLKNVKIADWQTYLRWNLVNASANDLSTAFVNANFDFYGRTLAGTKELQPRWKRVLTNIDKNVGDALGELYVAQFFSPAAKAGVLEMVNNIKVAMHESIDNLAWMSATTKLQAIKKLDAINVKIGYPDKWRDYSALVIDADSYANDNMRANQFEFKRMIAKLGKPIDRNEWGMTAPTVNAYYNPTMNEIVFPAGILQPPLYHLDADLASNYGNTGATIGHEMTHAFDDEGRQFNADGNLKSWWTKQDEKNFIQRASAIEKQFDEFNPIDNLHINGKLTAGENIADLGGMKIALQALRTALKGKPQVELIDGLTPEQRYFVANAQSFRGLTRPEQLRLQLATDPHAPEYARVLGPIANMPEFTAAFNCPADKSPLRPSNKLVNIW